MKRLLKSFIKATKPFVWRLAEAYDLRVNKPLEAFGQHPLLINDDPFAARDHIPKSVYFNTRSGSIVVGENTVFGEDVKVLTGKHISQQEAEITGTLLHDVPTEGRSIEIGENCYIGSNAILIGPLKVGEYAVIGAGAVVTKDVEAHTFVAGNPAKLVRTLK